MLPLVIHGISWLSDFHSLLVKNKSCHHKIKAFDKQHFSFSQKGHIFCSHISHINKEQIPDNRHFPANLLNPKHLRNHLSPMHSGLFHLIKLD